jgi:soluble lytic murein transglycosylase-like protein
MARLLPVVIGLGVAGVVLAIARESVASVNWDTEETAAKGKKKGKSMGGKTFAEKVKIAARNLKADVRASAYKWAKARNVPVIDVLTTIVLESRGDPKAHALTDKEDSRGAMQVNIRAHSDTIKKLGYKPDDLYKLDVGIEVGTYIYAAKRKAVLDLLKKTTRKQEYDPATLIRLYYAGPKYAIAWITKGQHFKNLEVYVDHWQTAKQAVAEATAEGAYA